MATLIISDPSDDDLDVEKLIQINELNLDQDMATVAGYYYRISCLAMDVKDQHQNSVLQLETHETLLADRIKKEHGDDITQTEIKRRFREDQAWQKLKSNEMFLNKNYLILCKASDALEMKSRMLTSLNKRQLTKSGMGMIKLQDD